MRTEASQAFNKGAKRLSVFYDLAHYPVSFDFIAFLMAAEIARITMNLDGLHVVIIPGEKADGLPRNLDDAEPWARAVAWRKRSILEGSLRLFPSIHSWSIVNSRSVGLAWQAEASPSFPRRHGNGGGILSLTEIYASLNRALPVGIANDSLRAPDDALERIGRWVAANSHNRRIIAITLRERPFSPSRNSSLDEWQQFIRRLDLNRYLPVLVPDTDSACLPTSLTKDCLVLPEASFNVALRLALYERAWLNLWVLHGPAILCWLSRRCRYIGFRITPSDLKAQERELHETALRNYGFRLGLTPRFSAPGQRWIWADDQHETIWSQFERMRRELERDQ